MRRILAILLALLLLSGGCALARRAENAYDLALQMAGFMPDMLDVKEMPLDSAPDRAIWYDGWLDVKCALVVCEDALCARETVLADSTRDTAVYAVGSCALYVPRALGAEVMLDYRLALADVLGESIDDESADYIFNGSTHTFHTPWCSKLRIMKEENAQAYCGDRDALLDYGYEPCRVCWP